MQSFRSGVKYLSYLSLGFVSGLSISQIINNHSSTTLSFEQTVGASVGGAILFMLIAAVAFMGKDAGKVHKPEVVPACMMLAATGYIAYSLSMNYTHCDNFTSIALTCASITMLIQFINVITQNTHMHDNHQPQIQSSNTSVVAA